MLILLIVFLLIVLFIFVLVLFLVLFLLLIFILILILILILLILLVFQHLLSECQVIPCFMICRIVAQRHFVGIHSFCIIFTSLKKHPHIMVNVCQFHFILFYFAGRIILLHGFLKLLLL